MAIFIGWSLEIIRLCALLFIWMDIAAAGAQKACKSALAALSFRFFGESVN